jgi:glycosyltransferase involved in cell wall biosynthesis
MSDEMRSSQAVRAAGAPSVLLDGTQCLSKTATGIGAYTRTLAASLRALGCNVGMLYDQRVKWRKRDPDIVIATQVFGHTPPGMAWLRRLAEAPSLLKAAVGAGGNARAVAVRPQGVELAAFEPPLPACDHVWNAEALLQRASRHFAMNGRFTSLAPPDGVTTAHWTAPVAVKARNIANIYTLHDLIPLQFPYFVADRNGRAAKLHAAIAYHADLIVTVSEASKRHIVELLGVSEERVSVTYQPAPHLPTVSQEDAERLVKTVYRAKPGNYALFVGAIEPKKNLQRLMEAFLLAAPGIPLLLVGPIGWLCDDELALLGVLAEEMPMQDRAIRRLGYLPRRHVVALMQCARFFVFPSVCEGFGLPALEAMTLGVPVLTSNTTSLPEVVGDAALQVDPLNIADLAKGVRTLANDGDLRVELARRGPIQAARFTPEIYRERLAAAYGKVGARLPVLPQDQPLLTKQGAHGQQTT